MVRIRRAGDRGHLDHGWLDTRHTFSFGSYHDPEYSGFRSLRVMNEDRVQPSSGFGTHGHRDMEILSIVLEGALAHRDSMGNVTTLEAGHVQRMTAGRGVRHSEFNPSSEIPVHFYQIWLEPDRPGLEPEYEETSVLDVDGKFSLLASPDGRSGSLRVHLDASVHIARPREGATLTHALAPGRHAWLQVLAGRVELGGETLEAGDGAAVSEAPSVTLRAASDAHVLLFDLA